jgi:plastocyanin
MTKIKLISIFILTIALFFLGCVEEKPVATPVPTAIPTVVPTTATPTPVPTAIPTVVPTTATPTPVPTQIREAKLYTSYVDDLYGFYKVTVTNGSAPYDINNRTLTINAGDTVKWDSATKNNYSLTIVSKEGLWDNSSSRLRYERSKFNYTFYKPGEYEVYIDQFPKLKRQKIVVNP